MTKVERAYHIDEGRFAKQLDSIRLKEVCFDCGYFDKKKTDMYRCACMGSCIGVTFSSRLNDYIIQRVQ